jgi:hypothetical protein
MLRGFFSYFLMSGRVCNLSGASRGVNFYLASQMPQFAGKNPALPLQRRKLSKINPSNGRPSQKIWECPPRRNVDEAEKIPF